MQNLILERPINNKVHFEVYPDQSSPSLNGLEIDMLRVTKITSQLSWLVNCETDNKLYLKDGI